MLHAVFRLVSKGLHYDQGQVEMLRRVYTDCDKVICLSVSVYVCVYTYMSVCVCTNDIICLQNGYPLVFLPTRKSHLDYVILSFLLVNLEIKICHNTYYTKC